MRIQGKTTLSNKIKTRAHAIDKSYVVKIQTPSDNFDFMLNIDDVTEATVNWGDGTTTTHTTSPVTHTYATSGTYTITTNGEVGSLENSYVNGIKVSTASRDAYREVLQLGDLGYTDCSYAFYNARNLTSFTPGLINTSSVTDMRFMFRLCESMTSIDVTTMDTSSVTNMYRMFGECTNLSSIDVSNFDTSNVIDLELMFYDCSSLTSLDVSNFDTSKVTSMIRMFENCQNLDVDVSNFNISSLLNADYMFSSSGFGNANYDKLLVSWAGQAPNIQYDVPFRAGSAKYTKKAERDVLVGIYRWIISDGGQV